ncbi:MAG: thioredoxin family protein, partial [Planctomycetales bacterium]|nr:thioredoxin family protein [Planctomycetales bacterium]
MTRAPMIGLLLLLWGVALAHAQQTRLEKVLADKSKFADGGEWIYQDMPAAIAQAKQQGKPLMVVLRCIPCEQCVKLDDDVIEASPEIKPLFDKFVLARVVSTNGLDLATFQFDTDQSWNVFFLNADGTIYGRFGTRSHRTEWEDDVSVAGLAKAMQGALRLHAGYPANKAQLAGKRGPQPAFASPDQYPSLKEKYVPKIEFGAQVVQSCIHCHQIGDAERLRFRAVGKPIPEQVLFPYPHPKTLGLILDPSEAATVRRVEPETPAAA